MAASPKVIRFNADDIDMSPETTAGKYMGAGLVGPPPDERELVCYTNSKGKVRSGIWECDAYVEEMVSYPYDEFMVILSGEVKITGEDGDVEIFSAGDSWLMPRGFSGTWSQTGKVRKYFVIIGGEDTP